MGAYENLVAKLKKTGEMQQVLANLEREPVSLLYAVCKEYETTKEPIPDHHLLVSGYLKEVSLRTLLSAGLLERQPGSRLSLYTYRPTAAGMKYYRNLVSEEWRRMDSVPGEAK